MPSSGGPENSASKWLLRRGKQMAVSIQASHLFTSHLYKTNPSLQTRLNDTADWCNEAGAEDRNKEPNQSVLLPRSTHQMSKIGNGLNLFLVFTRTCVSAPGLKREQMNSCFFFFFFFSSKNGYIHYREKHISATPGCDNVSFSSALFGAQTCLIV